MNSFLSKLQSKLHDAKISEVNHELGKVKEAVFQESANYFNNFKSDAANVGSLIR